MLHADMVREQTERAVNKILKDEMELVRKAISARASNGYRDAHYEMTTGNAHKRNLLIEKLRHLGFRTNHTSHKVLHISWD